jgi:hypothetical protein
MSSGVPISNALSTREQRELFHLIAKVQQAALQAQSTPVPRAAGRQRPSRLRRYAPTVKGTRE